MFTLFASRGLFLNLSQKPIELLASVGVIHFTFSRASVLKVILILAVNNERGNQDQSHSPLTCLSFSIALNVYTHTTNERSRHKRKRSKTIPDSNNNGGKTATINKGKAHLVVWRKIHAEEGLGNLVDTGRSTLTTGSAWRSKRCGRYDKNIMV